MKITFDWDKFVIYWGKLCPCLIVSRKNAIKENICPCKKFINTSKCRCGLFKNDNM